MTDPTNLPRLYGEKQIGEILKRATELQLDEPSAPAADSMTLQELEDIASEAGIDPVFLRRAALEVDTGVGERSTLGKLAGEEFVLVREITIPGELREDGFERIVMVLDRGTGQQGQSNLLGRTITWRTETNHKNRTTQVTVSSRDGQTSIRLEENLKRLASEIFGVSVAAVGGAVGTIFGVTLGGLLGAVVPVGVVGVMYVGARTAYRAIVKRRRRVMAGLFDQVVTEARACVADKALPSGDGPPELTAGG